MLVTKVVEYRSVLTNLAKHCKYVVRSLLENPNISLETGNHVDAWEKTRENRVSSYSSKPNHLEKPRRFDISGACV
jgi:hypothetical protein